MGECGPPVVRAGGKVRFTISEEQGVKRLSGLDARGKVRERSQNVP